MVVGSDEKDVVVVGAALQPGEFHIPVWILVSACSRYVCVQSALLRHESKQLGMLMQLVS